jgi:hypothetical protein
MQKISHPIGSNDLGDDSILFELLKPIGQCEIPFEHHCPQGPGGKGSGRKKIARIPDITVMDT